MNSQRPAQAVRAASGASRPQRPLSAGAVLQRSTTVGSGRSEPTEPFSQPRGFSAAVEPTEAMGTMQGAPQRGLSRRPWSAAATPGDNDSAGSSQRAADRPSSSSVHSAANAVETDIAHFAAVIAARRQREEQDLGIVTDDVPTARPSRPSTMEWQPQWVAPLPTQRPASAGAVRPRGMRTPPLRVEHSEPSANQRRENLQDDDASSSSSADAASPLSTQRPSNAAAVSQGHAEPRSPVSTRSDPAEQANQAQEQRRGGSEDASQRMPPRLVIPPRGFEAELMVTEAAFVEQEQDVDTLADDSDDSEDLYESQMHDELIQLSQAVQEAGAVDSAGSESGRQEDQLVSAVNTREELDNAVGEIDQLPWSGLEHLVGPGQGAVASVSTWPVEHHTVLADDVEEHEEIRRLLSCLRN